MKPTLKSLFLSAALLLPATGAFADGTVSGQILDSKTGDPLTGVIIVVKGSPLGTATDIDGRYTLTLPAGNYELEVRYLGYTTKAVSDVVVTDDAVVAFNSVLTEESKSRELGEVVVRATLKKESINALYVLQKNNVAVSSGISADVIAKSPDRSTGEVLKRVSGASVQNNKFVIVRGLSDRYNIAMLNGALMPSTEPDRKAFSFDVIPSNLIDNLIINKTASADLPGDFAGGVIQVLTRDVPDENFFTIGIGAGYNTQSTGRDFVSNGISTGEVVGFGKSSDKLPAGFGNEYRTYTAQTADQQDALVRTLPNNYEEKTSTALPPTSLQASLGNVQRFKNGGKLGTVVGLIHRASQTFVPNFERAFYEEARTVRSTVDSQWRFNSMLAGLANVSYVQGKTKFGFKNLYNKIYDNIYYRRSGFNTSNSQQIFLNSTLPNDRQIFSSQLEAEQLLGKNNIRLYGNLNFSSVSQKQLDLRTAAYARSVSFDQVTDEPIVDESVAPTLNDKSSRRFFSELTDRNYGGQVYGQLPFKFGGRAHSLKAGYLGQYKTRDFNARIFQYERSFTSPVGFENQGPEAIFAPQNVGPDGLQLNDITAPTDRYKVRAMLNAGYLLLDNSIGEKWRLSWGGRFEHYDQTLTTRDGALKEIDTVNVFADFLPSFNLAYNLSEQHKFRLSGSRTVNRPEFREIAPFAFYDFENLWTVNGNPALKRGLITNADVRYEWYPNPGETITVGSFYKYFETPIETGINPASNADATQVNYSNAESAYSFGVELDVRKSLAFITPQNWAKNTTLGANFTYIKSEVNLSNVGGAARPLQGQSPYLINFSLLHTAPKLGMSFSALYNRVGERIALVGGRDIPNTWERARDVLDISISKTILKDKGEFKLTVADLFNQSYVYYWNAGGSANSYQAGTDKVFQKYQLGTSISLGFGYRFGYGKSARSPVEVAK